MNIMEHGPKMLKNKVKQDWHDILAEQVAVQRGGLPEGTRMDFHHTGLVLNSTSVDLTDSERATAANWLVGGVWDVPRLLRAGYAMDPDDQLCQVCQQATDTIEHRLFDCKASSCEELRQRHLPKQVRAWLGGRSAVPYRTTQEIKDREQRARELARCGLAIDPSVDQPPPPQPPLDGETGIFEGNLDYEKAGHMVFPDGACSRPFHPRLARATWSAVLATVEGEMVATCSGPVWAGLPQTAPCAETVAAAAISQLLSTARKEVTMVGDNKGVVDIVRCPPPMHMMARLQHSGLWRHAMTQPGWQHMVGRAEHIKSHQLDVQPQLLQDPDLAPALRHRLLGNQLADRKADDAHEQHPKYNREEFLVDQQAHRAARAVVELAARILPMHPRRAKHLLQKDLPPTEQEGEGEAAPGYVDWLLDEQAARPPAVDPPTFVGMQHWWKEIHQTPGTWRCTACGRVANTGQMVCPETHECPGSSRVLARVGRGHRLLRYRPLAPDLAESFACSNCCRAASAQQVFAKECTDRSTRGRRGFFNRLERGLHPHPRWGNRVCYAAGESVPGVGV